MDLKKDLKKKNTKQIPDWLSYTILFEIVILTCCLLFVYNAEATARMNDGFFVFMVWMESKYFWSAFVTIAIFWGILYCVIGNLFVSYIIMDVLTLVWGVANKVLMSNRSEFISLAHLNVLDEATDLQLNLESMFHPIILIFMAMAIVLGALIIVLKKKMAANTTKMISLQKRMLLRCIGIFVCLFVFMNMYSSIPTILFNHTSPHKETGAIVWFSQSLLKHTKSDIDSERAEEIYQEFIALNQTPTMVSDKRPNIIVIMSEAFWDVSQLDGIVNASENPMDKYNLISEDCVKGSVAVNVYGGGTNHSEFEFLTGMNSQYILDADCYGEFMKYEQDSMVRYLEELGYCTMALHPYDKTFWEREKGFANIGFNEFYHEENFYNKEWCHGYVSDMSLTREIIKRFEECKNSNPNQPVFSFATSIQNHVLDLEGMHGDVSISEPDITIQILKNQQYLQEENVVDVEEYYKGIDLSLDALEELLAYFENYEEDTVVVFFGDHAPGFVRELYSGCDEEQEKKAYQTPYMIWTNYDKEGVSYGDFNLSYLSSVLIDYLELPKPQQYYINMYMLKNHMINTKFDQKMSKELDENKVIDLMNVVTYFCNESPNKANVLPNWEIVEQ